MKIGFGDHRIKILLALVLVFLACRWGVAEVRSVSDINEVKKMTATMKTVCVGRFLIDLPAEAHVYFRGAFLHGWNIASYTDESDEEFAVRLDKKEAELKTAKNGKGLDSLEATVVIDKNGVRGKVFLFGRTWTRWNENENPHQLTSAPVHAYVRVNDTSVSFTTKSSDTEDVPELAQVVTQLKALKPDEIPTEAGFCFGPAMIRDPLTASQTERVTMFLSLKDHPDMMVSFYTAAGLKPGRNLLERDADNDTRQVYASRFHTFRRADRVIAGLRGQELAERVQELNGVTRHSFTWELVGQQDDLFHPDLSLELITGQSPRTGGQPVESSLSDNAVLALWDKIASSIRVRPTRSDAPGPAEAAERAPHGGGK